MYRVMIQVGTRSDQESGILNSIKIRNGNEMAPFPSSFLSKGIWTGCYQPFQPLYVYQSDGGSCRLYFGQALQAIAEVAKRISAYRLRL